MGDAAGLTPPDTRRSVQRRPGGRVEDSMSKIRNTLELIAPGRDLDWIAAHSGVRGCDLHAAVACGRFDSTDDIRRLVRLWEWQGDMERDAEEIAFALLGMGDE